MCIRVALDQSSVHYNEPVSLSYIDGKNIEEYYFDNETAQALETDGFLTAMWAKLDAVFDWGDCDFFPPEKCAIFKQWLSERLCRDTNPVIRPVYETMLDFANKALANETGISFDF